MTEHSGSRRHCTYPFKNEIFDLKTVQIQGIFASLEQVKIELRPHEVLVSTSQQRDVLKLVEEANSKPYVTIFYFRKTLGQLLSNNSEPFFYVLNFSCTAVAKQKVSTWRETQFYQSLLVNFKTFGFEAKIANFLFESVQGEQSHPIRARDLHSNQTKLNRKRALGDWMKRKP